MAEPNKLGPQGPKSPKGVPPSVVWSVLGLGLVVLIGLGIYYARKGQPKPARAKAPPAAAKPVPATNSEATVAMSEKANKESQGWSFVPKGLVVLDGTTFLCDGAIRTSGLASAANGGRRPGAFLDNPVNRKGSRIHLLQASEYAWRVPPGAPYGHFVLHYADGKTHSFDLNWGIHGWDWFRGRNEKDKEPRDENTHLAWEKQRADGMYIRAYHTILENPYPDVVITSFDVIQPLYPANLLLWGFTVDDDPRPLADAFDPADLPMGRTAPQTITFTLQDAAGKPLPEASLSWTAVANRGRIEFPPFRADALGQVKIEVPRGSLFQINYRASGPEGKQAAGVLRLEEGGLFPDRQIIELTGN